MPHPHVAADSDAVASGAAVPKQIPVDKIVRQVTEISTLPHIALRVMAVANDPDAGAADLRVVVEGDPSLSGRVLKCVNSAAFGLRNKVTSLQRAISYLGFKQVRNLAVTASVSEVFKKDQEIGKYRRSALWQHLVSVAVTSKMIAARQKITAFEEVFLAGLLHDLGIILEDQYVHDGFVYMLGHLTPGQTLPQMEQHVLGFDHTQIGARVAEAWRFPDEARDTMRFHHMPENYRGPYEDIIACVVLANILCTLKGIPSIGENLLRATPWSMDKLGLNKEDVKVIATDLDEEFKANEALFKL